MIRIGKTNETRAATPTKKSAGASATFKADSTGPSSEGASAHTESVTSTSVLGALIALQSDCLQSRGQAKTIAAAQQTLDSLEQLRLGLLDGQTNAATVNVLEAAAKVRAHAEAEPALQAVYDEIALRARVELAKLGR